MEHAALDARRRLGLFAVLLAVALMLHQLWWDGVEVGSLHGAVVAAALVVIARPTSVLRLVVLLALEVVAVARDMPGAGSHTVLVAVCAATVLADVAVSVVRTRRLPGAAALWVAVAPFLRAAVVVLYVAAALAKVNSGFFDPARSCAAAMSSAVAWWDPSLLAAHWIGVAAIYGSLATECALAVLLAVRRTRSAGLVLGVAFHVVLALAGNVPFSSLLLALYVAFLPPGAMSRVAATLPPLPRRLGPAVALALGGSWLLGAALADAHPAGAHAVIADGTRLVVLGLGLAAAGVAARVWSSARRAGIEREPARLRRPVLLLGLAVLVANAASPYLGLKTESSFTMFSNLQTEAGSWNHLVVPEAVRIFGEQDHLVAVTASSDPALLRRTSHGTRMVRFELERYLRAHPGVRATYGGRTVTGAPGGPGQALVDRVAKFRDVRPLARRGC